MNRADCIYTQVCLEVGSSLTEVFSATALSPACSSDRQSVRCPYSAPFLNHAFVPPPLLLPLSPSLSPFPPPFLTQGQADQTSVQDSHHNYPTSGESITTKHHYFQSGAKH